jgi:hypothetical protein
MTYSDQICWAGLVIVFGNAATAVRNSIYPVSRTVGVIG